jgi:hypothetical protein
MDWHPTVRYNIHMLLDEDDFPLPQPERHPDQWAEDQFDDELMRDLMRRNERQSNDRPSRSR